MSAREYAAYQLFVLAERGVEYVRLCAVPDAPAICQAHHNRTMPIEAAMRDAPIPHALGPDAWCSCTYRPALPQARPAGT